MTPAEYYAPLQAAVLALLGVVDLTSSDAIDVREEHDPITTEVLEPTDWSLV